MQTSATQPYIEGQTPVPIATKVTRKPLPPSTTTHTLILSPKNPLEANPHSQASAKLPKMGIMKPRSLRLPDQMSSPLMPPQTTLKKSKSVGVRNTLRAIANPVKTRKDKKTIKSEIVAKEKEEAARNVEDFLKSGRMFYEKQLKEGELYKVSRL